MIAAGAVVAGPVHSPTLSVANGGEREGGRFEDTNDLKKKYAEPLHVHHFNSRLTLE